MQPEKEKDTSLPSNAVKLLYNQPSPEINPSATTERLLYTSHSQNI
jgi:hypothetical protein